MGATVTKVDVSEFICSSNKDNIAFCFHCTDGDIYCPSYLIKSSFELDKDLTEEFGANMFELTVATSKKNMELIIKYIVHRQSDEFMEKNIELKWENYNHENYLECLRTLMYLGVSVQMIIYFVEDSFNQLEVTYDGFVYYLEEKGIVDRYHSDELNDEDSEDDKSEDSTSKIIDRFNKATDELKELINGKDNEAKDSADENREEVELYTRHTITFLENYAEAVKFYRDLKDQTLMNVFSFELYKGYADLDSRISHMDTKQTLIRKFIKAYLKDTYQLDHDLEMKKIRDGAHDKIVELSGAYEKKVYDILRANGVDPEANTEILDEYKSNKTKKVYYTYGKLFLKMLKY